MPLFGRRDGHRLGQLSPSRALLPMMLGPATEAWVLAEAEIRIQPALDFIDTWNQDHDPALRLTLHTLLLRACALAFAQSPRLNRFVAGYRYYQRDGIYISFSAKKEFSESGGLLVLKRRFEPGEPLEAMVQDIRALLGDCRQDSVSVQEKETALLLKLPRPLTALIFKALGWLDACNLLPPALIEHHPLYASLFIANLGSLGLNSGWHHLYRLGNIPVFGVLGAPYDAAVVEGGQVVARKVVSLKWTFDERIEDGYNAGQAAQRVKELLENPESLL